MNKKEKSLLTWLIAMLLSAVLAGVYINLTIMHYQSNGNWPGDCVIVVLWSLAALVDGWRVWKIVFENYRQNKKQ